ncbi:molybdopterin molybdotransferase MoeA [Actinacidiphila reveromycinica]|uniref:molybdopterin molybdotransferase MoeA n=1 Tax=Actinacidiphila reveromycinica TaxID=659352 RepID=UPI001F36CA66
MRPALGPVEEAAPGDDGVAGPPSGPAAGCAGGCGNGRAAAEEPRRRPRPGAGDEEHGGAASRPYDLGRPVFHRADTGWSGARHIALTAARRLDAVRVPLGAEALGAALAQGLAALTDLPPFDSSAMDGWALAGPGPWRLTGQVLAGQEPGARLADRHAVRVATGAELPAGATAVLRNEHGAVELRPDGEWLRVAAPHPAPRPGQEVRRRGQECRAGEALLPAGVTVTPAVLGLAAASGYDDLAVVARPRVELLVLGDELLAEGQPGGGRVRDALGPMLPPWLRALGADVVAVRTLPDDAEALRAAISDAVATGGADLVVTTGGTASGPRDHVHGALARLGARLRVDGVTVRPGHPMLLAEFPCGPYGTPCPEDPEHSGGVEPTGGRPPRQHTDAYTDAYTHPDTEPGAGPDPDTAGPGPGTGTGTGGESASGTGFDLAGAGSGSGSGLPPRRSHFVGLPGNPLAAVAGVLTLVAPLLRTLGGHPAPASYSAPLTEDIGGHPTDTRLVPVVFDARAAARPLRHTGSAMLRGLAAADGMAVVPPGGAKAGEEVGVLDIGMPGAAVGNTW